MLRVFLLIAAVFALGAVLCAFATFSRSPTVRRTATRAIYGSLAAAVISAALGAWISHRQRVMPLAPPNKLGMQTSREAPTWLGGDLGGATERAQRVGALTP
jgi:hypothetical protein